MCTYHFFYVTWTVFYEVRVMIKPVVMAVFASPCFFPAWWLETSQTPSAFISISLLQVLSRCLKCILSSVRLSNARVSRTSLCTLFLCHREEPSRVHLAVIPCMHPASPWVTQSRRPCGVNGGIFSAATLGLFLRE